MIRAVICAFIGYVIMVICAMCGIAVVWLSLGNEFAFSGGTTKASTGWSIVMLMCGLASAVAGGWMAARIGGPKARLAVRVLIGLIVVLGIDSFVAAANWQPPPLPEGVAIRDLTFMEAGEYAVSPMWYNVAIVVVGGTGTWLGGCIRLSPQARQPAQPISAEQ